MFNEELCGYVTEVTMLLREGTFSSKMLDQKFRSKILAENERLNWV